MISYGATACYSDVKVFVLVRDVLVAGENVRALLIITLHVDDLLMAHSHVELRELTAGDVPTAYLQSFLHNVVIVLSKQSAISSHFKRPLVFVHGVGTRRCGSAASSVREVRGGPNRMRFGIRLVSLL